MNRLFLTALVTSLFLIACSPEQPKKDPTSDVLLNLEVDQIKEPEAVETLQELSENTPIVKHNVQVAYVDYSKMPIAELQEKSKLLKSEIAKLRIKIDELESLGATRKEIYLERKRRLVLINERLEVEKAETAAVKAALAESCLLVKSLGGECAE